MFVILCKTRLYTRGTKSRQVVMIESTEISIEQVRQKLSKEAVEGKLNMFISLLMTWLYTRGTKSRQVVMIESTEISVEQFR